MKTTTQSSVCEVCGSWMEERQDPPDGYLRCSQGHYKKIIKRIIEPKKKVRSDYTD